MKGASSKTKQLLVFIIKLLIVAGAFYFIYDRVANNPDLDWIKFTDTLQKQHSFWPVFMVIVLSIANRYLEILKWQNLVSYFQHISLMKSAEQVLAALTAGLFTPNGIGEYAAKAMFYKKHMTKDIVFLNLVCNGIQLIIAVGAGLTGLLIFQAIHGSVPTALLLGIFGAISVVALIILSARGITVKGFSLNRLFEKIAEVPTSIHQKNIFLASCRYLSIIHQHYFIFLAFDVALPYPVMISVIACVYFLGSSLPSFQFLDFAVRGSVAVYFFGMLGINEWIVVFAATLQWLLNIVIPVSIGSFFVFRFRPPVSDETGNAISHPG